MGGHQLLMEVEFFLTCLEISLVLFGVPLTPSHASKERSDHSFCLEVINFSAAALTVKMISSIAYLA